MPNNRPSIQALLVCEMVISDATNGNKSIIGTFTHVFAPSFPCRKHQIGIYFCVTDAEGEYDFKLDLVHIKEDKMLGSGTITGVKINDRLDIVDFGVTISPVTFPEAGRYEYRLYANNEFVGNKDFNVVQVVQKNPS